MSFAHCSISIITCNKCDLSRNASACFWRVWTGDSPFFSFFAGAVTDYQWKHLGWSVLVNWALIRQCAVEVMRACHTEEKKNIFKHKKILCSISFLCIGNYLKIHYRFAVKPKLTASSAKECKPWSLKTFNQIYTIQENYTWNSYPELEQFTEKIRIHWFQIKIQSLR